MKQIVLKGSAKDRGYSHGKQMREDIRAVLDYYQPRFPLDRHKLQEHVDLLMEKVTAFKPEYKEEMDAIGAASGVEPFWIYCINARSELMSSPIECSSIAFPANGILGQNWDWADALEGHLALADIELTSGSRILTMTEPGMLGKIGMNSSGLGVCLNILPTNEKLTGLPVHILLRSLLECKDIGEAKGLIESHGAGKASHVLVANKMEALAAELAPAQPWFQSTRQRSYVHTNHYFQPGQAQPNEATCTETRLRKIQEAIKKGGVLDINKMRLLLDNNEQPYPILRPYSYHPLTGKNGTLVTLMMDLGQNQMLLREGHNPQVNFQSYSLV